MTILTDRTETIRASVNDVQFEMMLTIGLVVMVIFLFLRNLVGHRDSQRCRPALARRDLRRDVSPGLQPDNLSLMALTISTGFVVDDAIVMIENIDRFLEEGDSPLDAALKGSGADRLHHRIADDLADRRADSAFVHGRYRRTAVPRIRCHAGSHDPGFCLRFADAYADDVREITEKRSIDNRASFYQSIGALLRARDSNFYGRTLQWVLKHQTATLIVTVSTLVLTLLPLCIRPEGLLPGTGHWRDSRHFRRAPEGVVHRHVRAPAGSGEIILQDPDVRAFPRSSASTA